MELLIRIQLLLCYHLDKQALDEMVPVQECLLFPGDQFRVQYIGQQEEASVFRLKVAIWDSDTSLQGSDKGEQCPKLLFHSMQRGWFLPIPVPAAAPHIKYHPDPKGSSNQFVGCREWKWKGRTGGNHPAPCQQMYLVHGKITWDTILQAKSFLWRKELLHNIYCSCSEECFATTNNQIYELY